MSAEEQKQAKKQMYGMFRNYAVAAGGEEEAIMAGYGQDEAGRGGKLLKALAKAGEEVEYLLEDAGKAGGEVFRKAAEENAPGPIIGMVEKASRGYIQIGVGPSKGHWYYRFFETGARPHEIAPKGKVLYIPGRGERVLCQRQRHGRGECEAISETGV